MFRMDEAALIAVPLVSFTICFVVCCMCYAGRNRRFVQQQQQVIAVEYPQPPMSVPVYPQPLVVYPQPPHPLTYPPQPYMAVAVPIEQVPGYDARVGGV